MDSTGAVARICPEVVDGEYILIEPENGARLLVPRGDLRKSADGRFSVAYGFDELANRLPSEAAEFAIPVIRERPVISRKLVDSHVVRIRKEVSEFEESHDIELQDETVEVSHVPMNEIVSTAPSIRVEGDTNIIPIVEEVLVVEKRLRIKEELRVRRVQSVRTEPVSATLKREDITIERIPIEETINELP